MPPTDVLTVKDVIAATGISHSTRPKLVAEGRTAPSVRIGAVQRIRREALKAWLRQHKAQNT